MQRLEHISSSGFRGLRWGHRIACVINAYFYFSETMPTTTYRIETPINCFIYEQPHLRWTTIHSSCMALGGVMGMLYGTFSDIPGQRIAGQITALGNLPNPLQDKLDTLEKKKIGYDGSLPYWAKDLIHLGVMQDPQLTITKNHSNAQTYDKVSYQQISITKNICPKTHDTIIKTIPNQSLVTAIHDWVASIEKNPANPFGIDCTTPNSNSNNNIINRSIKKLNLLERQLKRAGYTGPLPEWLLDPITKKVMVDPVTDIATGQTFDKKNYEDAKKKDAHLTESIPNRALKEAIEDWVLCAEKQMQKKNALTTHSLFKFNPSSMQKEMPIYCPHIYPPAP